MAFRLPVSFVLLVQLKPNVGIHKQHFHGFHGQYSSLPPYHPATLPPATAKTPNKNTRKQKKKKKAEENTRKTPIYPVARNTHIKIK